MRNSIRTLLSLSALATTIAAQSTAVFPSDHASIEGSSYQGSFPFSNGISRQQAIYHRRDLTIPNGARISRVGVRQDAASSSTGYRVQLEVLMGQTTLDTRAVANAVTSTFATNYTGTPTTAFARRIVDLPNLTATSARPAPTNVMVALDAPFTYSNTQNLIVDWMTPANANGNQAFGYYMDFAGTVSATTEFGTACRTSGSSTPRCYFNHTVVGSTCSVNLAGSSGSSPSSLFLGVNRQPNPVPLDGIGMPGCFLHIDPMVTVSTNTNSSGGASLSFPVPNELFFIRRSLVAQYVSADLFANNLGLVSSNGAQVTIGVAPLLTVVVATGSTTATTGSVYRDNGSVSVFEYQ
jgi:hypothetical protein